MNSPVHRQTVFIVDDDASVRDALALLLSLRGYPTALFACAEDFLRAH
jgi:two-component system, LuxR family, response regulator FixJ